MEDRQAGEGRGRKERQQRPMKRNLQWLLAVMAVLYLVLLCISFYTSDVIDRQVMDANQMVVELYVDKLDNILASMESEMARFLSENKTLALLESGGQGESMPYLRQRLDQELSEAYNNHSEMDGAFVRQAGTDSFVICINSIQGGVGQRGRVIGRMEELCNNETVGRKEWLLEEIGDQHCLVRIMHYRGNYIGCFVRADKFLKNLSDNTFDEFAHTFLADADGVAVTGEEFGGVDWSGLEGGVYRAEEGARYVVLRQGLPRASFDLVALSRYRGVLMRLNGLQILILAGGLLILAGLAGVAMQMRKRLLRPVMTLVSAMGEVERGNLEIRVPEEGYYKEFTILGRSFNRMVAQICQLKIDVYEEQLNRRATRLQFLQIQTNPHFFLNALNVIYSLTLTGNVEVIKQLTFCLMKHFRFILRARESYVALQEELAYIDNFIEIQKIRFSYQVEYRAEIEVDAERTRIPPMLVQTFVENSIKYGVSESGVWINVRIWVEDGRLHILEEDGGPGIPEDVQERIRRGETVVDAQGKEHYGICNVASRLAILYGDQASLAIGCGETDGEGAAQGRSRKCGARVLVELPLKEGEKL